MLRCEVPKIAVFSLEMTKEALIRRMICAESRVSSHGLEFSSLSREEANRVNAAAGRISDPNIHICDKSSMSVYDIVKECRQLKQRQGLDLVVIDYLQLMAPHSRKREQNRTLEVGEQARILKTSLAKDLDVCCVTLSQLSRAPETRPGSHRPILSDLRDSGELEQHADTVGFLFREEVYRTNEESLKGKAEFIVSKQRNGPIGWVPLTFLAHLAKFENMERE